jgi:hypothetical protein
MGVTNMPSVPYGDDHKDLWDEFIEKVKQDFGTRGSK